MRSAQVKLGQAGLRGAGAEAEKPLKEIKPRQVIGDSGGCAPGGGGSGGGVGGGCDLATMALSRNTERRGGRDALRPSTPAWKKSKKNARREKKTGKKLGY